MYNKETTMIKKTIQELKAEGYRVYSESEAREIIAEDIFEGLAYDQSALWDIVWGGYKGVDDMTLQQIEEYFADEEVFFEWSWRNYDETGA